jgi:diguanylate cyclase (GGDEF)-like protein
LLNFRSFQESLKKEHERASRYQSKYSVLFCDLDHFKHYNDKHGHPAGDELLRTLGQVIQSQVRKTDEVFRYGGEEFVVLCCETDLSDAVILAERIRKAVMAHPFAHREEQPLGFVSFSLGVASYPGDGAEAKDVVEAADGQVYLTPALGRITFLSLTDSVSAFTFCAINLPVGRLNHIFSFSSIAGIACNTQTERNKP